MSSEQINICLATDHNYVQHAGVTLASILRHADPTDSLKFYIIENQLSREHKENLIQLNSIRRFQIEFIKPQAAALPRGKLLKYVSEASLFRLGLAEYLLQCDRVIYLDCDVIVLGSLQGLWQIDLPKRYLAAGVADYNSRLKRHCDNIGCKSPYINSGVLLLDLYGMRKQKTYNRFVDIGQRLGSRAVLLDQDIINVALAGKILLVSLAWNLSTGYFKGRYDVQYYSDEEIIAAVKNPKIVHFSGKKKPWVWKRCRHPFWEEYFRVLKHTPWKKSIYRNYLKKIFLPSHQVQGPARM